MTLKCLKKGLIVDVMLVMFLYIILFYFILLYTPYCFTVIVRQIKSIITHLTILCPPSTNTLSNLLFPMNLANVLLLTLHLKCGMV